MQLRRLSLLVPIPILLLVASCGRDADAPLTPSASPGLLDQPIIARYIEEPSNPPPRSTPEQLLTSYFEQVYTRRDSVLYAAMLDRRFTFVFLPQDADSLGTDTWTKRFDLRSTGAMFRDERVVSITLNIQVDANLSYLGDDCDDCREMLTTITLRVLIDDDSGEPLALAVDSPQVFVVRPDAIQTGKWVIWRQVDMNRVREPGSRVSALSWGNIKALFSQ